MLYRYHYDIRDDSKYWPFEPSRKIVGSLEGYPGLAKSLVFTLRHLHLYGKNRTFEAVCKDTVTHIRIIGIGSPAGDDQAGWWVVDALRRSGVLDRLPCTVDAISLDRPGAQLINHFSGADAVILIDAIKSDRPPGTIHRIDDIARLNDHYGLSSHGFGLASALALAHALGTLPKNWVLYGIQMENDRYDSAASATVREATVEVAQRTIGELRALLASANDSAIHT